MMRTGIHKSPPHSPVGAGTIARQFKKYSVWSGIFCFSLPVFAALVFGGCPQKHVQPKFAQTGVLLPPRVTPVHIDITPPAIDPVYDGIWPVLVLSIPPPKAPPVHRAPYVTEPELEVKPEAPRISPQLSPQQKNSAQGSADADLRAAQQSLDATAGRKLNANQQDLADKINGFIRQAREAKTAEDWLRAQSLAHKAKVLGGELIQSF
jgi:hypothetical protein